MKNGALTGVVLFGMNNIYSVEVDGRQLECRIKGKRLRTDRQEYNPLAVGDRVRLETDPHSGNAGWIVSREPRRNVLSRWNKKRKAVQTIAANVDLLVAVSSVQSPPFRPRFVDRLLVAAEAEKIGVLIVVNKVDLAADGATRERLANYERIGYRVLRCSALRGRGISALAAALRGKVAVLFGQSGVGKSSLINAMHPALELPVGDVSRKYDRGSHTTSFACMLRPRDGLILIDTPGIREFETADIEPEELRFLFPELARYAPDCAFSACQHIDEPDCAVLAALERGEIHPDRYESYLRIHEDLESLHEEHHGSPYT